METITLQYDATNPGLNGLIAALLKLDGVKLIKEEAKPAKKRARKTGIERAIEDFKTGNTVKCKDFDDYLQKVNA